MLKIFVSVCFLTAIFSMTLGVLVYLIGEKTKLKGVWALLSLSIGLWVLGLGMMSGSQTRGEALFYLRWVHYVGAIFIPIFYFHFISIVLGSADKNKAMIKIGYVLSVLFQIANLSGKLATVKSGVDIFNYYTVGGILYALFSIWFFLYVGYAVLCLYKGFKQSRGRQRIQLRYIFIASLIGFIGGGSAFLPVFNIPIHPIGMYWMFLYTAMISYAITRHRLMDIRIFAARFLIFSFVYIPILLIPYAIGYMFKLSWILPTILETIFAPGGLFVYLKIQERAERKILQSEYRNASEIRELARGIVRLDDVAELGKVVVERLEEITKVEDISLYVIDENRTGYSLSHSCGNFKMPGEMALKDSLVAYLQEKNIPVMLAESKNRQEKTIQMLLENKVIIAVPVLEKGDLLGVLLLGEKPDDCMYSQVEVTALDVLSKQVAFSIQIIQFIEEKEEMQRAINEVQRMKEFRYLTSSIGHVVGNGIQSIADVISTFFVDPVLQSRFSNDNELEKVIMDVYGDISDNITNLKMVTKSLRNYIREEDPGERVDVEVGDLIKRVVVLLKVRNRGMKVMNVSVDGKSEIKGNPGALQAIFYNLLNNCYDAIIERENSEQNKSSDKGIEYVGDVKIDIKGNDNYTEVRVKDNGIGMSADVQSRIFTPLFTTKSHEVTKDSRLRGGTGIGMETIKKMISGHSGKIKITWSEKGKGTEFLILFPKDKGEKSD